MDHILVAENESEEPVEFPLEEDGTVLLSTIAVQFPGATGLKFTNPSTGGSRVIRLAEDKLYPPEKNDWGDRKYFCVFPRENKRKFEGDEELAKKLQKLIPTCTDLIVLGLPWETTDTTLRAYFEKEIGEVAMVQVKKNMKGESRGFGFVRFKDYEKQRKALLTRHHIDGRWCDVSLPPSSKAGSSKVFVGRLTTDITEEDLKNFFSTMGDVTDVFIPKPFRGFGFVTFLDPEIAKTVCKMDDVLIKDVSIHTESATPKAVPLQQATVLDGPMRSGVRNPRYGRGYHHRSSYNDNDNYGWDNGRNQYPSNSGGGRWNQGNYNGPNQRYMYDGGPQRVSAMNNSYGDPSGSGSRDASYGRNYGYRGSSPGEGNYGRGYNYPEDDRY